MSSRSPWTLCLLAQTLVCSRVRGLLYVAAFLLVFVDASKELSATILLRPFDFETLATFVYAQTSRAAFEDGAIAALLIVLVGILPVVILNRSIVREIERG